MINGQLDELAVWDGALSAAQVQQVYNSALNNVSVANAFDAPATLGAVQADLVGSWNMDQANGTTAAADSINANHANLSGHTPASAWVDGQVGRALSFDGSNDQAVIGQIPEIAGSPEMTLSLWVRNDGSNENSEGVFQHRDLTDTTFTQSFHGLNTPGGANPNDIEGRVNRVSNQSTGADSLPIGEWTHVLQTFKGNEFNRIYLNGELVADVTPTSTLDTIDVIQSGPNGTWRFGNDIAIGGRFFNGLIDDAGMWSRAVSEEEIAAIFQAGQDGISHTRAFVANDGRIQSGIVSHWTFDQARFHETADDSHSSADANLVSMDSSSDWVNGQISGALNFDGDNDQAVITGAAASELNTALNGSDALTMSLWVRSEGTNNNHEGLFEHRSGDNTNLTGFNTPGGTLDNFNFRINSAGLSTDAGTLVEGEWQHLVGVWQAGERFEIWLDGVLVEEALVSPDVALVADGDWRFGNDIALSGRFFNGSIDDAGLWNRALSELEILGLFQSGQANLNLQQALEAPEPASIALWTMLALSLGLFGYRSQRKK